MSYEQYWFGDPYMVGFYRDAYILKRRITNEDAWIAGSYVLNAVSVALNNALSKTPAQYVKKPFDLFPKTRAEKELEVTEATNRLIEQLSIVQAQFNAKHKNKGVGEDGPDNS